MRLNFQNKSLMRLERTSPSGSDQQSIVREVKCRPTTIGLCAANTLQNLTLVQGDQATPKPKTASPVKRETIMRCAAGKGQQ